MSTTAAANIPDVADEDIFLDYQKAVMQATATHPVTVCEKSRRIGVTWAIGADAVLTAGAQKAAGGMDALYIGYNLDMAREFIDTCAAWAKAFNQGASAVDEFLFKEPGKEGDREIQAYRINFASGFEIVALASRPRSLRGRQGYVIVDEAAFHDDLKELLKAALALLIWGGKVLVISTHDGVDNEFNHIVQDIRAGKSKYALLSIDFDEALEDGLYRRICKMKGETWSIDGERRWRGEIIDFYGDAADEELFLIPRKSSGDWLTRDLIESRMIDAPVLRWTPPAEDFVTWPEARREAELADWLDEHVRPLLEQLDPKLRSGIGEDFGRTGDLTVMAPNQTTTGLVCRTPFLVELRNCPFQQQKQVLFYIIDGLPRFANGALDARGNGHYLAEVAMQRYGATRIHQVMFTEGWYRDHTAPFKAAHEDGSIEYPRDAEVLEDLRAFEVRRGVPRLKEKRTKDSSGQRHGDAGIALLLGHWASRQPAVEFDSLSSGERASIGGRPGTTSVGWGTVRGIAEG